MRPNHGTSPDGGAGGGSKSPQAVSRQFLACDQSRPEVLQAPEPVGRLPSQRKSRRTHRGVQGCSSSLSLFLRDRPKTSYGGKALESCVEKKQIGGVHPHNETVFLFNLLAYQVMYTGRCLMEEGTRKGWSIRRFRRGSCWPLRHIFLGGSLLEHALAKVRPVAMGRGSTAGINPYDIRSRKEKKGEGELRLEFARKPQNRPQKQYFYEPPPESFTKIRCRP